MEKDGDSKLIALTNRTLQIMNQGYYEVDGEHNSLVEGTKCVKVCSFTSMPKLGKEENCRGEPHLYLIAGNSCSISEQFNEPLLVNITEGITPGGEFLTGGKGEEESLCYRTTLFRSLSSEKAKEAYALHIKDRLILSPRVQVFRAEDFRLLKEPYEIAVVTMPLIDEKKECKKKQLRYRFQLLFYLAEKQGYDTIIFGNSTFSSLMVSCEEVLNVLYEIIIENEYINHFSSIVFAVDGEEQQIMMEEIDEKFMDYIEVLHVEDSVEDESFVQFVYPMPDYNRDFSVVDPNYDLGYAEGTMKNGIPFLAECWRDTENTMTCITFILPELKLSYQEDHAEMICEEADDSNKVEVLPTNEPYEWHTILCHGMRIEEEEPDSDTVLGYIILLASMGVVSFQTKLINGSMYLLHDYSNRSVVSISIILEDDGVELAKTPLVFSPYLKQDDRKKRFKVVK